MCVCARVRAGFVFVPAFEIQFCLSVFYAWDYSRCSHCYELLHVGISHKTVMCTNEFRQTEVHCKGMGAEEKVSYVFGVW
jgi:hypothetical protein